MTMRQNTRRTAFEMFRRGFSVSDAALERNQRVQVSAIHPSGRGWCMQLTSQRAPSLGKRSLPAQGRPANLGSCPLPCF
jgi:hypothetical protein